MNQIAKYVTPQLVEQSLGLAPESIDSFAFLVMQEQAKGVETRLIAKGLEVDESELDLLADSVTGGPGGLQHELWKQGVILIRSITLANQQAIGTGWDALEAMAVNRLARVVQEAGDRLSTKDAVAIAAMANKAVRRGNGEGAPPRASLSIHNPNRGGDGMTLELTGGNLGSIRMSLTQRVQEQLEQPRIINAEPKEGEGRRMLTLEETRNVKPE